VVKAKGVDPKHIALVGRSRLGKAALLAAAFDPRVALVIPCQAGQGGTSPARTTSGETVAMINRDFPHWFNGEFKKFNSEPERLPFDHHTLIALVAPTPVLLANADQDEEANPPGQFKMLSLASRVYEFLGASGLEATSMPPAGKLIDSRLGYFIRHGQGRRGVMEDLGRRRGADPTRIAAHTKHQTHSRALSHPCRLRPALLAGLPAVVLGEGGVVQPMASLLAPLRSAATRPVLFGDRCTQLGNGMPWSAPKLLAADVLDDTDKNLPANGEALAY
jgi:hypothetical protein